MREENESVLKTDLGNKNELKERYHLIDIIQLFLYRNRYCHSQDGFSIETNSIATSVYSKQKLEFLYFYFPTVSFQSKKLDWHSPEPTGAETN